MQNRYGKRFLVWARAQINSKAKTAATIAWVTFEVLIFSLRRVCLWRGKTTISYESLILPNSIQGGFAR